MKVAILLVATLAVFAAPSTAVQERGVFGVIGKLKEFLEYLKSPEFLAHLKSIESHVEGAPDKAVECFKTASEGVKGDREAAIEELRDALKKAFHHDDEGDKNAFVKLLDLIHGLGTVISDPTIAKDLQAIGSQYKDALDQAMGCFKNELQAAKDEAESVANEIKAKFF